MSGGKYIFFACRIYELEAAAVFPVLLYLQSWAMPDCSLTSGTGRALIPECRLQAELLMPEYFFSASQQLLMITK